MIVIEHTSYRARRKFWREWFHLRGKVRIVL
jgi:hypothetical protein